MKKGKLIIIEGTDCSGKKTQTELLIKKLIKDNIKCVHMSFPKYEAPTGKIIGECILGRNSESWFKNPTKLNPRVASLYYAADRLDSKEKINKLLSEGTSIVCDRYVESNMGHQAGKLKDEERKNIINFIINLEYNLLKLPKPEVIIFLHMPYNIGMKLKEGRPGKADAHESDSEHLKNAEKCYLELAKKFNWEKVDCTMPEKMNKLRTKEDISDEIYGIVKRRL
jgi:dTMP kinase